MLHKKILNMKIKIYYTLIIALGPLLFVSCKKDNYAPPSITLSGKLVYKGEALQLQYNQFGYELYQYGFGKVGAISQVFAPDGSYSSLLFAGDYKFTVPNATVPFKWPQTVPGKPDSMSISLTTNKTLDIEVVPFYMVRTPKLTAAGGNVNATFKADKIVTDATGKEIDRVALFINKTQFVSSGNNESIQRIELLGTAIADPNNITLSLAIPAMIPTQNYIFARVGIQVKGLGSWIYSPVQKIPF
jgi:Domain of unknown function (DUF3823_C)/Protein of unknown function (DUF3823) N-terminal domain